MTNGKAERAPNRITDHLRQRSRILCKELDYARLDHNQHRHEGQYSSQHNLHHEVAKARHSLDSTISEIKRNIDEETSPHKP